MTLRVAPMALGGRLLLNLAKTAPVFPWALAILPQMVYNHFKRYSESAVFLASGRSVNVHDSLAEIVGSSLTVIDAFESQDALMGVLLNS
jgi:hypothetical protein